MEIKYKRAYSPDINTSSVYPIEFTLDDSDFNYYLDQIIREVKEDVKTQRFNFPSEITSFKTVLDNDDIYKAKNLDSHFIGFTRRLLRSETTAQEKYGDRLGIEVQKGILIYSLVEHGENYYFFIVKAEKVETINENSKKIGQGLPIKKKIYKSVCAILDKDKNKFYALVGDSKSSISKYWWDDFLELTQEYSDSTYTVSTFDTIEKILNKIKSKSKPDYFQLRNTTLHYFRTKNEFILEDYLDNVILSYPPIDETNVNVTMIENQIRKKIENAEGFTNRFNLIASDLHKRMNTIIKLTPQIDLFIKEDIEKNRDIIPREENGEKYIMIRTNEGFEYFQD